METILRWKNLGGRREERELGEKSRGILTATNTVGIWTPCTPYAPLGLLSLAHSLTAGPLSLAHGPKVLPPPNPMEEGCFIPNCAWQQLLRSCYLDFLHLLVILTPLDCQDWFFLPPEDSGISTKEGPGQSVQEGPGFSSRLVSLKKCS